LIPLRADLAHSAAPSRPLPRPTSPPRGRGDKTCRREVRRASRTTGSLSIEMAACAMRAMHQGASLLLGSPRRMGKTFFVGGVSNGEYGLAAFELQRDGLSARKSRFFFDDEYVCLGAGIAGDSDAPVVTTLNQCNLAGDVLVAKGDRVRKLDSDTHLLDNPDWLWHDEVGYVLLAPGAVRLRNAPQRGSWWEINHEYSRDAVARMSSRRGSTTVHVRRAPRTPISWCRGSLPTLSRPMRDAPRSRSCATRPVCRPSGTTDCALPCWPSTSRGQSTSGDD